MAGKETIPTLVSSSPEHTEQGTSDVSTFSLGQNVSKLDSAYRSRIRTEALAKNATIDNTDKASPISTKSLADALGSALREAGKEVKDKYEQKTSPVSSNVSEIKTTVEIESSGDKLNTNIAVSEIENADVQIETKVEVESNEDSIITNVSFKVLLIESE